MKVMKPIVADICIQGIKIVICLDGIATLSDSYEMALASLKVAVNMLESLEFIVNQEKTSLVPIARNSILRICDKLTSMKVSLPVGKIDNLILLLQATHLYNK